MPHLSRPQTARKTGCLVTELELEKHEVADQQACQIGCSSVHWVKDHFLPRFVIMSVGISVDRQTITDYCQRWQIAELALFGSVLRDDLCR